MDNLFIDYETYWGTKYSLRTPGMSDTDYVLHEKFQIHGASVAINKETPYFLKEPELRCYLRDLNSHKIRFIAHRVLFDGIITTLKPGVIFKTYFCTLAMLDALYQGGISVGLDEAMKVLLGREGKTDIITKLKDVRTEDITPELWAELILYANEDLAATQDLYYQFGPTLPDLEHTIMDIVLRMFCDPALVFNDKVLREAVQEADDDRESRIANALALGTTEKELKGNNTFPALLDRMGYKCPMKPSPTVKGKMIPALAKTDVPFQEMLESTDEKLKALVEGRLAVKSTQATTRAYRFLKLHELLGYLPVAYNYARAHTWRVTGANKYNCANLKRGSKLRTCIEAPPGFVLGVADASQIECRSDGYIAGQDSLMELFKAKIDPYNDMASDIFGKPIDRPKGDRGNPDHELEGFLGKKATLGLGFQMGGTKFQHTVNTDAKVELGIDLNFPLDEAFRVVDIYRSKNYKIKQFWGHCKRMLFAMVNNEDMTWHFYDATLEVRGNENKIYFPNGTWLYYPGISWRDGDFHYFNKRGKGYITKYIYGGLLCENIVQHFARNITSWHMALIAERYQVVLHTYDENVALIPEAEADEGTQWMIELMKTRPWWAKSLPLDAEGGWAKEYSK